MRHLHRRATEALVRLAGGLATAVLALGLLLGALVVAATCLFGVGFVLLPGVLRSVRSLADRERARLSRRGPEIPAAGPLPDTLRAMLRDPFLRRELGWLAVHGTSGFLVALTGLAVPLTAVQDLVFPLYYRLLPADFGAPGLIFWHPDGLLGALGVALAGAGWLALSVLAGPALARWVEWPGRRLLPPPADLDLSLRVAELTATRAAALDAHAVELRRIERSLHDGAQNRLVAVTVLLGAARRALARDPAAGAEILDRAHEAAEQALADLRTVVRGILPPVLDDRGLAGALDGLAAGCPVPCRVEVDVPGRCAASVEATAYFVVAEALTNVVKHAGAASIEVTVRRRGDRLLLTVTDDGKGGADETTGSGLPGIRRRIEAYDGRFALHSPPGGPTTLSADLPCGA